MFRNLCVLSVLGVAACWGQNSSIQGIVSDESQAVVAGASVTAVNEDTGVKTSVRTNDSGYYSVVFLRAGNYRVEAQAAGFAAAVRERLKVDVQQVARLDFSLKVGAVTQSLEVSSAAALLESESTTVGSVIDNKRIVEMPLNRRNYLELARLTPGILPASTMGQGIRTGQDAGIIGMGQRGYQTNILVDGIDDSSRGSGGGLGNVAQAITPPVEALEEFKVVTNNMSAEYGFKTGPKVMVSIKGGSNALHGSVYEFLRNDKLDAANFFANRSGAPKPTLRQNQFGAAVGGPIVKNRTFFFGSFQGTRIRLGRSVLTTVPSVAVRAGDFSGAPVNINRVYDPLTLAGTGATATQQAFPGFIIPESRMDPVSKTVIGLYPLPNQAGRESLANNFFGSPVNTQDANYYDMRFDHNFSDRDRVMFRASVRRQENLQASALPPEAGSPGSELQQYPAESYAMNWNHSFSAGIHNELRAGYTNFPVNQANQVTEPLNAKYGIKGAPGDGFDDDDKEGFAAFVPTFYQELGTNCCRANSNNLGNLHIADSVLVQRGKHLLKFGGEFRRTSLFREAQRNRRGRFMFSGVYTSERPNDAASRSTTGNPMADMMLGMSRQTTVGNQAGENGITSYSGFFVQDDWKISPRLTLNAGLRWELFKPLTFPVGPAVGRLGVSNFVTEFTGDPRVETFLRPEDGSDCGCKLDKNNFAPRLGLAYRLNDNTVLRAGAGMYYGEPGVLAWEHAAFFNQTPDFTEVTVNGTNTAVAALVRNGFAPVTLPATAPVGGTNLLSGRIQRVALYVSQWFFDVQRRLPGDLLATVGYEGSSSKQLERLLELNNGGAHPSIPENLRRPRPQWNLVSFYGPGGNANYNALLARLEKRFAKGLTFLTAYTWSHNTDDQQERFDGTLAGGSVANWKNISAERASSNLDHRHAFTTSFTYEVPIGKGRPFGSSWHPVGRAILGGWEVGGIVTLRSGFPFDVSYPGDPQNSGSRNRGNRIAEGTLAEPTIDRWFDQSAFVISSPGVYGNAGRNVLYGPGTRNLDLIVARRFAMPWEGHQFQFRFESFNSTNTPKFGQPSGNLRVADTATINQADEPRRIQFALKYVF